jgi:Lar family restriction alleviation protein
MNIKPCPFCGNIDHQRYFVSSYVEKTEKKTGIQFVCKKCQAFGPGANNEKDAVEAWNIRKNDDVNNCPFCNSKELRIIEKRYKGEAVLYALSCDNCHAISPFKTSEDQVKKCWSNRNNYVI